MHSSYITLSGSRIYYEKTGSGEPLIFVHADTLDARQWEEQVQYFSHAYQVVTYDIRGFGKSDLPSTEPYSFSEDLLRLMDSLSIEKAHLVGLSMGAAIIIDLALTHPERVASLTLADPGVAGDGFAPDFVTAIAEIISLAKDRKLSEVRQRWASLPIFDVTRQHKDTWAKVQQMVDATPCYRWYGKNQPISISPPAAERLSAITAPTLVLVGEHDIADFQRKALLLHERIPGSSLATVPEAGHLSNMDNPVFFNAAIEKFLAHL